MSIYEKDMFGISRHQIAIDRIKTFCAGKKTLVAFSGGKDSQVCYHLCEEAGITFVAQYSVTRFEPPELLRFIRQHYPAVSFRRAYKQNLVSEIASHGLPNRWARWCCGAKHKKNEDVDITIIGVRWEESPRRRETWRMFGMKPDKTSYLCPIIEWTEADIWEYLGNRPHCSLYDEGFKRIGCVMCPLSPDNMGRDAKRWPKTAAVLRIGADAYVARARLAGFIKKNEKPYSDWCREMYPQNEYWRRWITTGQTAKSDADHAEDELCLFAGTGFDEADGVLHD